MEASGNGTWRVPRGYRAIPRRLNLAREAVERPIELGKAGQIALRDSVGALTYGELAAAVNRCAGGLRALGLNRGDAYLIRTPNCRELVIAFLAGAKLGATPIMAHSLLGTRELRHILENGEPAIAIVRDQAAEPLRTLRGEAKRLREIVIIGEAQANEIRFDSLLTGGEPVSTADTRSDEPGFMVYTSGTTGLPKGIVHAHRWIISVGHPAGLHMPLGADDIVMHTSELSFIWGLGHGFLFPLAAGASIALMPGRPSSDAVMAAVERFGVTVLATVPTLIRAILGTSAPAGYRIDSLERVYASGEALGEATYREWTRRFNAALYEVYGVSEFQVIVANGPAAEVRPGSMGRAHPGVAVAVIDESLNELGPGGVGSFAIRADDPGLFLEYRKQDEKWREAHRGPWYDTGDQVYRDEDGYFWYLGRQDDLFKSRGYLISPREIEEAILGCGGVSEVAVAPEADPAIGNRIKAFVVLRDGKTAPSSDELRALLRKRIAPYKVPHSIEFVPSLPKSAVGKILRAALRADKPGQS